VDNIFLRKEGLNGRAFNDEQERARAIGCDENTAYTWSSNNPDVATVENINKPVVLLEAVKLGKTNIHVSYTSTTTRKQGKGVARVTITELDIVELTNQGGPKNIVGELPVNNPARVIEGETASYAVIVSEKFPIPDAYL